MALQKLPPPPKTDNEEVDRWLNLLYNSVNSLSQIATSAPADGTDLATTEALANDIKARLKSMGIYK